MRTELERASAFEEAIRDACADRVLGSRFGTGLFADSLPRVWSLNVLRVETSGASADELAGEAEHLQGEAGLPHRRVLVLDESEGRRLEARFAALGWKTDVFLYMALRREPSRAAGTTRVVEVEVEALAPLRERIVAERLPEADAELARQIHEATRRVTRAVDARHFAVVVDGRVVSSTDLYSDGRVAQVEDVMTLPEQRGRGFATALVLHAVAEAEGHELVFLTADARDWPKDLYGRLGFDALGQKYAYLNANTR